ncbi:MAG: signal peptidase II [Oscillospiraceae bacterium]|nr:signal peptidase II [Oscillospiraceae bacterium]
MIPYIFIAILIVLLDQITKILTTTFLNLGEVIKILPGILSFTYIRNEGAAFGILQGARVFFMIITVVVFLCAIYYIAKTNPHSKLEKLALCFMAGGAIGNFIDRAVFGYVRDFILVEFIDFPVFNIADCFVCIGAGFYILYAFSDIFKKKDESR